MISTFAIKTGRNYGVPQELKCSIITVPDADFPEMLMTVHVNFTEAARCIRGKITLIEPLYCSQAALERDIVSAYDCGNYE